MLTLVDSQSLDNSPPTRDFITQRADQIQSLFLAGGTAAISEQVEQRLSELVE